MPKSGAQTRRRSPVARATCREIGDESLLGSEGELSVPSRGGFERGLTTASPTFLTRGVDGDAGLGVADGGRLVSNIVQQIVCLIHSGA